MSRNQNDRAPEPDLLDSDIQAAGKRDFDWALRELADGWISNGDREGRYGFYQTARPVLEMIASDTATSMRDKCVDSVRAIRNERAKALHVFANSDNHEAEADHERAVLFVLAGVIDKLSSLTLDQVEQEKHGQ